MTPRRVHAVIRLLTLSYCLSLVGCRAVIPPSARHVKGFAGHTTGMDVFTYRLAVRDPAGGKSDVELTVARFDLRRYKICVISARDFGTDRLTASEMLDRTGALAAINGGFFDENARPLGLRIRDGIVVNRLRHTDWGVWFVDDHGAHISHTRDFRLRRSIRQAVQCGPRLVVAGKPIKLKPQCARRSAVGIDGQGRCYFISSGDSAIDAGDFARWLAASVRHGGLGLQSALNLDGGPSAQLAIAGAAHRTEIVGMYGVPDGLAVFPRQFPIRSRK